MKHGWHGCTRRRIPQRGLRKATGPLLPSRSSFLLLCDVSAAGGQPRVVRWSPAPVDVTLCRIERLERLLSQVGHFCSLTYLRPITAAPERIRNTPLSVFIHVSHGLLSSGGSKRWLKGCRGASERERQRVDNPCESSMIEIYRLPALQGNYP